MCFKSSINKIISFVLISLLFVSCSSHKNMAYDFVKKTKGASVAFYVPKELLKTNLRDDFDIDSELFEDLDEDQIQDSIDSRTEILNKIDDYIFLNVMIASFEETLRDYDLKLEYWKTETAKPDSLHWVVDLSQMEIQELVTYQYASCGDGNYEIVPLTRINVAAWFELINDEKSTVVFSEQNYEDYISDCYYRIDSANNVVVNVEYHSVDIDGFYDFAVMLGKLYAGYCYDFFMNEYVRKEMTKKDEEYYENYMYMRYDPYEYYIYSAYHDRFIKETSINSISNDL